MAVKFSNNAATVLAADITSSATSITVADGSVFPTLSGSEHTYVTLEDLSVNREIVKVTAISGNSLTVVRAQDGTTARAFSTADKCELRITAASLNDLSTQADTESVSRAGDSMTGDLSFGDNDKATFGAGDDLRIYHDGSNSYIADYGTGDLKIRSNKIRMEAPDSQNMIIVTEDAGVQAFYNGTVRLAVNNTGIDVTGDVVASRLKTEGTEPTLFFNDTTTGHDDWKMYADWDQFQIQQYVNDTTWTSRLHFAANGNATFSSSISATQIFSNVNGNTTTGGNIRLGITGNNQPKYSALTSTQYAHDSESEGFSLITGNSYSAGVNSINIGGGFSEQNAATSVSIRTATNANTRTGTSRIDVLSNGNVIVNENSTDSDFRVESDTNTHALFVDAGTNTVIAGGSTSADNGNYAFQVGSVGGSYPALFNTYTGNALTINTRYDTVPADYALQFSRGGTAEIDGTTAIGGVKVTSSTLQLAGAANKNVSIKSDGTGQINLDAANNITIPSWIERSGDPDTYFGFPSANQFKVVTGGVGRVHMTDAETVFTEGGEDRDFRVESNDNANMFLVDGTANKVVINNGGNDELNSLQVNAGITSLNGNRFIKAPAWGSLTANTSYYLFTFDPAYNGQSGHTVVSVGAGGVDQYATFNLVAKNAGGTTYVTGYVTGSSTGSINLIGYRDNSDATKVHVYIKPTSNISYTPRVAISGTGSFLRKANAPSSPVDEDYTFSSASTYNYKLTSATGLKVDSAFNDALVLRDARTSSDTSIRFKSNIEFLNYHNNSMIFGVEHNDYSTGYRRGFIKFNSTTNDANMNERVTITGAETVLNEESGDHDFRVESNSNANMLFVDGGNNTVTVGSGVSNAGAPFLVDYNTTSKYMVGGASSGISNNIYYNGSAWQSINNSVGGGVLQIATDGSFAFRRGTASATPSMTYSAYIDGNGNTGLGTTSPTNYSNRTTLAVNGVWGGQIDLELGEVVRSSWKLDTSQNVYFGTGANDTRLFLQVNDTNIAEFASSNIIFNEAGNDVDFRVESDVDANSIFVNGENGHVDIGSARAGSAATHAVVVSDTTQLGTGVGDTNKIFGIRATTNNSDYLTFRTRRLTEGQNGWNHSAWDITRDVDNTNTTQWYQTFGMTETVFNEGAANLDFRVETYNKTHALFVDANVDTISTNGTFLHNSNTGTSKFYITRAGATNQSLGIYVDDNTAVFDSLQDETSGANFLFRASNATSTGVNLAQFDYSAGAAFNDGGVSYQNFRVESDSNANMLFVDAGTNGVGIGKVPHADYALDVDGQILLNGNTLSGIVYNHKTSVARPLNDPQRWYKIYSHANASSQIVKLKLVHGGDNSNFQGEFTVTLAGYGFKHSISCDDYQYYNTPEIEEIATRIVGNTTLEIWVKTGALTAYAGSLTVYSNQSSIITPEAGSAPTGVNTRLTDTHFAGNPARPSMAVSNSIHIANESHLKVFRSDDARSGSLFHNNSGTVLRTNNDGDNLYLQTGGTGNINIQPTQAGYSTIINDDSSDVDFRVESNNQSHMLFVDATSDCVSIGSSSDRGATLNIEGNIRRGGYTTLSNFNSNNDVIAFNYQIPASSSTVTPIYSGVSTAGGSFIHMESGGGGTTQFRAAMHGTDSSAFTYTDAGKYLTLYPTAKAQGQLIVNDDGNANIDFRIESDSNANMLFVDASTNSVNIGTSTNSGYTLNVAGAAQVRSSLVVTSGGGANLTQGDIMIKSSTVDSPSARGQGVFMFNEGADQTWYAGTGYNAGAHYHIGFAASASASKEGARVTNGVFHLYNDASGAVFNQNSADRDFRVESDYDANAFFLDGQDGSVGIGSGIIARNPTDNFTLNGKTQPHYGFNLAPSGSGPDPVPVGMSGYYGISFCTNGVERLAINRLSEVVVNDQSTDHDFRVESNSNSHALFLDAAEDKFRLFTTNVNFSDSRFQVEGPNDGWCVGLDVNATNSGRGAIGISIASGSAARVLRVDKVGVGTIGFINQSDSGLTYTTTSDRRLKKDIETITDGTDKLMAMNPVTHGWKADPEADTVHGFIAQEMQEIVPEAVSGDPESDEMMSMDYGRITPVLVAALQDAHKKIAELETRLNELEGK